MSDMGQGYRRKTYRLKWPEGHELHGLEVVMRGLSLADYGVVSGTSIKAEEVSTFAQIEPMARLFVKRLVSWNYENENGDPIGTDYESIVAEADIKEIVPVIFAWAEAVTNVAAPLPRTSNGGQPSEELSLPMEVL